MKRRFIAGAKCPKCSTIDSIIMLTTADDEWVECIDCDYSEQRPTTVDDYEEPQQDDVGVVQFRPMKK